MIGIHRWVDFSEQIFFDKSGILRKKNVVRSCRASPDLTQKCKRFYNTSKYIFPQIFLQREFIEKIQKT